jgi:hypothetical protein
MRKYVLCERSQKPFQLKVILKQNCPTRVTGKIFHTERKTGALTKGISQWKIVFVLAQHERIQTDTGEEL